VFNPLIFYINKETSLETAKQRLASMGYCRTGEVFELGDFSVHGDTLEIFPVNFAFPLRIEWEFDVIKKIYSFNKQVNRSLDKYESLVIIPRLKQSRKIPPEDIPLEALLKISINDYVVHAHYGIGKFNGTKKMTVREKTDYYFELEYSNKDKLYICRDNAHLIQKYVNFNLNRPKLTRLGTNEWKNTKEKIKKGIRNFALGIIKIQAHRQIKGGIKYPKDTDWQKRFESSFPYLETKDQANATKDVKKDMESVRCMDRIICGDVGYGKTEIAMRCAFKGVMSNYQVAFLVPTTILAYQHYANLKKRLSEFPFYVEMISRFRSSCEQKEILLKLKEGKIDIIIGTHRILSPDVIFNNLGLLIVDEEHKFGVEHKERIKQIKSNIDVLLLTATPIPRTLYMSMVGIKQVSLIKTAPLERLAIKTRIINFDHKIIRKAITDEIGRGGQVFFIHNRIESIELIYKKLKKILPKDINIQVVHGKMPSRLMEKVIVDFINKKIDCLLSTAIIESGIDIPSANTIIINDAHRFGLADLHQLRGRVGRINIQAYAYVVVPKTVNISENALNRLKMLEKFSDLGAGFNIAQSDLELRGAGNILGKEQHGFIYAIGFDMYCRLLRKEVGYLQELFQLKNN